MHELKKHKAAIIILAIILIAAIAAVAVFPSVLRRVQINDQFEIAQQYLNDLDYESALLIFTKILEIDPNHEEARMALQDAYLAYIRSEWDKGNADHAIALMADMKNALGLTEAPYTVTVTKEPTCGAVGLEIWTCNFIDDVLERDIPVTEAHIWDDGSIRIPASNQTKGVKFFTCTEGEAEKSEGEVQVLVDDVTVIDGRAIVSGYHVSSVVFEMELVIDGYYDTDVFSANTYITDKLDEGHGLVKGYAYLDINNTGKIETDDFVFEDGYIYTFRFIEDFIYVDVNCANTKLEDYHIWDSVVTNKTISINISPNNSSITSFAYIDNVAHYRTTPGTSVLECNVNENNEAYAITSYKLYQETYSKLVPMAYLLAYTDNLTLDFAYVVN